MMTFTIEALKRLDAEATPGEWDVSGLTVYDTCMDGVASTHSAADAALIVAMRNSLPELLSQHEQLIERVLRYATDYVPRKALEDAQAALAPFSKYAGPLFERGFMNGDVITRVSAADGGVVSLTAGDFFQARRALPPHGGVE